MRGVAISFAFVLAALWAQPVMPQTRAGGAAPAGQPRQTEPEPDVARELLRQAAPREWERPSPAPGRRTPLPTDEERGGPIYGQESPPVPRPERRSPVSAEPAPGGPGETPDQEIARPVPVREPTARAAAPSVAPAVAEAPRQAPEAAPLPSASVEAPAPTGGPAVPEAKPLQPAPPGPLPNPAAAPQWLLIAVLGLGLLLLLALVALVRRLMAPPPASVSARVTFAPSTIAPPVFAMVPEPPGIGLAVQAGAVETFTDYPAREPA